MTEKSHRLCIKDPGDDGAQRLADIVIEQIRSHEIRGNTYGHWCGWVTGILLVACAWAPGPSSPGQLGSILWAFLYGTMSYATLRYHRRTAFDLRCALMSVEHDPENLAAMMQAKFAQARPMGRLEAWLWDKQYARPWMFVPMRLLMPDDVLLSRMAVHSDLRYRDAMAAIEKLGTESSEVQTHWHRYRCNEARARVMQSHRRFGRASPPSP